MKLRLVTAVVASNTVAPTALTRDMRAIPHLTSGADNLRSSAKTETRFQSPKLLLSSVFFVLLAN